MINNIVEFTELGENKGTFFKQIKNNPNNVPKFVRRYANLAIEMEKAIRNYVQDVEKRDFPNANESY